MHTLTFTKHLWIYALIAVLFTTLLPIEAQPPDNPDLINITTVDQLNAIRWDLDGDGTVDANRNATEYSTAFGTPSCAGSCTGYELRNDLDFTGSKWAQGGSVAAGWKPIGNQSDGFEATLEGNGYTISNFYINRPSEIDAGLFNRIGTGAFGGEGKIANLGLEGSVTAGSPGALVADNFGQIIGCYANVRVVGKQAAGSAGGLVKVNNSVARIIACYATGNVTASARAGGLCSSNMGIIAGCYATGNIQTSNGAGNSAGGLVGSSSNQIYACYATGNVNSSRDGGKDSTGGLVGTASGNSIIRACYARGNVGGAEWNGGLVGSLDGRVVACYATGTVKAGGNFSNTTKGLVGAKRLGTTVQNSYFDYESAGRRDTEAYAKSSSELQTPTDYADIYQAWDVDVDDRLSRGIDNGMAAGDAATDSPWNFGSETAYPTLKVDLDASGTATREEFGTQRLIGPPVEMPMDIAFIPAEGVVFDRVIISGLNFSDVKEKNIVTFGGAEAVPYEASTTTLKVEVPSGASTGAIGIKILGVASSSNMGSSSEVFTVTGTIPVFEPIINDFVPKKGAPGTEIVIFGSSFSDVAVNNAVTFGNIAAEIPSQASSNYIVVKVPADAITGTIGLTVTKGNVDKMTSSSNNLEVLAATPEIDNFSPKTGEVNTKVTITGSNFSTTPSENTVTFGVNVKAVLIESSETSIKARVPDGAKTGPIRVAVNGQTAVSNAYFTVRGDAPCTNPFFNVLGAEGGELRVFPNPTSDQVRVIGLSATGTYKVYSLVGQALISGALDEGAVIDVSSLSQGQYVLVVETEEGKTLRARLLVLK